MKAAALRVDTVSLFGIFGNIFKVSEVLNDMYDLVISLFNLKDTFFMSFTDFLYEEF